MKISTSMLLLSLACSGAHAGFIDGNRLQQWSRGDDSAGAGLFMGYVVGVADTGDGVLFCPGIGVIVGQLTAVVAKYLENNPEQWDHEAMPLVTRALLQAFPCEK
jgi:hypothetical protein